MSDASGALVHNHVNGSTATISLLFIVLAVIFGLLVYRFEMPLGRATLLGVAGIVGVIALGLRFPVYAGYDTWMWLLGLYILVASVTPVWILLQPRDYLSSFLLYAMMLAAVVGIVAAHPVIELPAFTSFEVNGQYLFPALFVTVACGAISGFHSLVASGTTSKQLSSERDARLVGFGSMLIESALGIRCWPTACRRCWPAWAWAARAPAASLTASSSWPCPPSASPRWIRPPAWAATCSRNCGWPRARA